MSPELGPHEGAREAKMTASERLVVELAVAVPAGDRRTGALPRSYRETGIVFNHTNAGANRR